MQLGEFVFQHTLNCLPNNFSDFFIDLSNTHNYATRSKESKNFFVPRINTNYGKFGLKYAATKIWNQTPQVLSN